MFTENMIAPCGLDCSLCAQAHKKEAPCLGCLGPAEYKFEYCRNVCEIMKCPEWQEKKYRFCDACPSYPCAGIMEKENRYRSSYVFRESPLENLKMIRELGMERFLEEEKKAWSCPACGDAVSVHTGICRGCGKKYTPGTLRDET